MTETGLSLGTSTGSAYLGSTDSFVLTHLQVLKAGMTEYGGADIVFGADVVAQPTSETRYDTVHLVHLTYQTRLVAGFPVVCFITDDDIHAKLDGVVEEPNERRVARDEVSIAHDGRILSFATAVPIPLGVRAYRIATANQAEKRRFTAFAGVDKKPLGRGFVSA